jgi:hypothetical protein
MHARNSIPPTSSASWLIAGAVGGVFQSWTVFFVALAVLAAC